MNIVQLSGSSYNLCWSMDDIVRKVGMSIPYVNRLGDFDAVVGIARGGMLAATLLAYKLDVPLHLVNHSSDIGNGNDKLNVDFRNPFTADDKSDRILLVDDIADTGNTMKEVRDEFLADGHEVSTYVLDWREDRSCVVPDCAVSKVATDVNWVVYPWEND